MTASGPVPTIDVTEAARRLGEPAADGSPPLLVDVREKDEFATVRVPGAVLVPLSEFAAHFASLPQDRPLLVMCAAGRRSIVAAAHLRAHGYSDVTNVDGGIIAWQKAGQPTAQGAPRPGEGELDRGDAQG